MPIETKEIAAEIFKKIKRLTNKKTVTLTLSSSPQLPRQPPLSPPLLPDAMLYFSIWRRIQRRLFPHQHKQAVTDLSTLPNRQMPSPAYIRCSACKSVFYRPSNLSMFRCPHCHCAHFDRHRQEDNELVKEVEQDEADGGMLGETFTDYRPSKLSIGHPHPDPIVETSSLSAVQPPEPSYNPKNKDELESLKILSCLQIETLVYACQRHLQHIQSGARAGFFIGDGAGVGKGRTIAGLIWENWQHGRKKALWISVASDLKFDARRDLDDMGASCIEVHALNKLPCTKLDSETVGVREGVIFSTYHSLISSTNKDHTRMQQLVEWCGPGFDGLIIFDECHKAKNLVPEKKMKPTKTGKAVLDIQAQLPEARVVYCSATGASEPRNMAYMIRLGLWGEGTYFSDFGCFLEALEKGGVGALELVAMDMKARGMYLCRTLSYKGAEFDIIEAKLDDKMMDTYKKATEVWVDLRENLLSAIDLQRVKSKPWGLYWSSHQRFFRQLCMSAKVPTVVRLVKQALKEDKCVVIGLQSTGEARMKEVVSKYGSELDDFISGPRELLLKFVEDSPLLENPELHPGLTGIKSKEKILEMIHALDLPNNPLDDIIDQLGGHEKVAEITGRKGILEREPSGMGVVYRPRNAKNVTLEMVNMNEKKLFMEGEKLVVIISEAGSAGFSLHADKRVRNQKRRVHLTLELSWSADRTIQQFGRTLRSNQVSAPEYRILFTDLGGERRFASAVAKRLESLGALIQGDRRAGPSLSAYNYDSAYGRKALKTLCTGILVRLPVVRPGCLSDRPDTIEGFMRQAEAALNSVGFLDDAVSKKGTYKVGRFLNRLLGIAPEIQNRLFELFVHIMDDLVQKARIEGNLDTGIVDLKANVIKLKGTPKTVYVDQTSGASTVLFTFILDRGVSWELANTKLNEKQKAELVSSGDGFYKSKREWLGKRRVILAFESSNSAMYKIVRPTTGESPRDMHIEELTRKYSKVSSLKEAKIGWEDDYEASSKHCMHGPCCRLGNFCSVGSRLKEVNVLGGAILPVWGIVQTVLSNQARQMDKMLRIVRVETTSDNRRFVGLLVPIEAVETVLEELDE